MNLGAEPLRVPAGTVLLRSDTGAASYDPINSGETIWLDVSPEEG